MPNAFTTTKNIGYGNRIGNSIGGVIVGIILVIVSFGILYWNEGRADLSSLAKQSKEISSSQVSSDTSLQGALVSTTGTLGAQGQIGDNLFLQPGNYVSVDRKVEMYSWIEQKSTKTVNNNGGSQTQTTTYTYTENWTSNPQSSDSFDQPDGHQNPVEKISSTLVKASAITIGAYSVDPSSVTLPEASLVSLNNSDTMLSQGATLASDQYLFIPENGSSTGSIDDPQLGDLRVSYSTVNSGSSVTVMGKLDGSQILPFYDQNNNELYRIFMGTRDQAISQLHSEYTTSVWIFRGLGFVLMLVGFMMIANPIATVLSILPIAGSIAGGVIFLFSLLLAVVLTIVTILVSMLFHSLIALAIAVIVVIVLAIVWLKHRHHNNNEQKPPYQSSQSIPQAPPVQPYQPPQYNSPAQNIEPGQIDESDQLQQ